MNINELLYQIIDNQTLILQELKSIKQELYNSKQTNKKIEQHVDFVEGVYNVIRQPINYITGSNLKAIEPTLSNCINNHQMDNIHTE